MPTYKFNVAGYEADLRSELAAGSGETSYYPAFVKLIRSAGHDLEVRIEKKVAGSRSKPDFTVVQRLAPLGIVEGKRPATNLSHLSAVDQKQFARYLVEYGNFILTNFVEFRWYEQGVLRRTAFFADVVGGSLTLRPTGAADLEQLLNDFLASTAPVVSTAPALAEQLARLADRIAEGITADLAAPNTHPNLIGQRDEFSKTLPSDLDDAGFADMYAQTLCYGLFAARCNRPAANFSWRSAAFDIPKTNPFLRSFFHTLVGLNVEELSIIPYLDDLERLLNRTDIGAILAEFASRSSLVDPVVYFYEDFLIAYDPKLRKARGVFYTPEQVVGYIVRSVDELLQRDFAMPLGLADSEKIMVKVDTGRQAGSESDYQPILEDREFHRLLILDPATGSGTFLLATLDHIYHTHFANNAGMWPGYVQDDLLPRLFGFELLMAPYAVAHFKLGLYLKQLGYNFDSGRLGIYLTNSLEQAHKVQSNFYAPWLSDEVRAANAVKESQPVMVLLGNPPYSNFGRRNRGDWILDQLKDYKRGLDEQKINLNDDFIKFIRFAQWRIERTGAGVVGFITSNTYLDGITHRQMRRSLMQTFDDIYILDLHGSSRKREVNPAGGGDENVFDIQQGVSITIFVKRPQPADGDKSPARIFHADVWGLREQKYDYLAANSLTTTAWQQLAPTAPNYFFVPKSSTLVEEYAQGFSVDADIFDASGPGVKTERDRVSIHFTLDGIKATVDDFRKLTDEQLRSKYKLDKDSRDWKVSNAKADVLANTANNLFQPILYRPFDVRYTWYSGRGKGLIGTPGIKAISHMVKGNNLALIATLQTKDNWGVFASNGLANHKAGSRYDISTLFPLYLYPTAQEQQLGLSERRANLKPEFVAAVAERLGLTYVADGKGDLTTGFGPEDIFHYMYAVFHSPEYRRRYAELLKTDYPRLPLTSDRAMFAQLCGLGARLVGLHLLKPAPAPTSNYPVGRPDNTNPVTQPKYEPAGSSGRVYINATQYFDNVPPEVWEFQIGGYQVAEKWLKDRKGHDLKPDDLRHYRQVLAALGATISTMAEVDDAINAAGGWPLA